jgi:hypothetical protein
MTIDPHDVQYSIPLTKPIMLFPCERHFFSIVQGKTCVDSNSNMKHMNAMFRPDAVLFGINHCGSYIDHSALKIEKNTKRIKLAW